MILLAFVISFVQGYIDCNDYYDIYDATEPIACSLTQDTPVNRAKYTDIEHKIVITDSTGTFEQAYPMDWNNDTHQWVLSTPGSMALYKLHDFQLSEYDAQVRTTCGYDLVETKFKLIVQQPLSEHLVGQNLHHALIEAGYSIVTGSPGSSD